MSGSSVMASSHDGSVMAADVSVVRNTRRRLELLPFMLDEALKAVKRVFKTENLNIHLRLMFLLIKAQMVSDLK